MILHKVTVPVKNALKKACGYFRDLSKVQKLNMLLLFFFPVYTVIFTEVNQSGTFTVLPDLIAKTPGVFLFDLLFTTGLLWFVILLVRRVWIAAAVTGGVYYILSTVEFFRFRASGQHFTFYDFTTITTLGEVAEFGDLKVFPIMVVVFAALLIYVLAFVRAKTEVRLPWKRIAVTCGSIVAASLIFFLIPAVSTTVFRVFGITYGGVNNPFIIADKFEKNNMVAFLVENGTEVLQTGFVKQPENYSEQTMQTLSSNEINKNSGKSKVSPNVLVIMSESYADFRSFEQLGIPDDYYKNFDKFRKEGYSGKAVVPTFGGYTIRSEFELLFGLPIKSLNSTVAPQYIISEGQQTTIPAFYKKNGYHTAFIHPYTAEFYKRGELYPNYGFDSLYFDDSMVGGETFHDYTDDIVTYNKALDEIKNTEEPCYIHISTMQNHMPYTHESMSQIDYYMEGIQHTDQRLGELREMLKDLDEPTIVLFTGDHYPFFTDENSVYNQLNINRNNCLGLYEQTYFVWSNYSVDFSAFQYNKASLFYLPHLVIDTIGLPQDEVVSLVLEQLKKDAVYTKEFKPYYSNDVLDTLTYDLILGQKYTGSKPQE